MEANMVAGNEGKKVWTHRKNPFRLAERKRKQNHGLIIFFLAG